MSYEGARNYVYDAATTSWVPLQGKTATGAQAIQGATVEQAGLSAGSLNADLVASTDVSAYRWLSLQILGTWTGTLTFQASNDNSNWTSLALQDPSGLVAAASTTTANKIVIGWVGFRYLRVRMTSYSSGTATGILELYTTAPTLPVASSVAIQSGTWTVQPGNTPNTRCGTALRSRWPGAPAWSLAACSTSSSR